MLGIYSFCMEGSQQEQDKLHELDIVRIEIEEENKDSSKL